jgi:hypothetical protein
MKEEDVIELVKEMKNLVVRNQAYEAAAMLRDVERNLNMTIDAGAYHEQYGEMVAEVVKGILKMTDTSIANREVMEKSFRIIESLFPEMDKDSLQFKEADEHCIALRKLTGKSRESEALQKKIEGLIEKAKEKDKNE